MYMYDYCFSSILSTPLNCLLTQSVSGLSERLFWMSGRSCSQVCQEETQLLTVPFPLFLSLRYYLPIIQQLPPTFTILINSPFLTFRAWLQVSYQQWGWFYVISLEFFFSCLLIRIPYTTPHAYVCISISQSVYLSLCVCLSIYLCI